MTRKRPQVMITLSPEEIKMLDAEAKKRALPRSRTVAALVREARQKERS